MCRVVLFHWNEMKAALENLAMKQFVTFFKKCDAKHGKAALRSETLLIKHTSQFTS